MINVYLKLMCKLKVISYIHPKHMIPSSVKFFETDYFNGYVSIILIFSIIIIIINLF